MTITQLKNLLIVNKVNAIVEQESAKTFEGYLFLEGQIMLMTKLLDKIIGDEKKCQKTKNHYTQKIKM